DQDVFSYRGVALPRLPNFFILNGPFSPVNNVTIPRTVNDEMEWICRVLTAAVDERCALAPTEQATTEFVEWLSGEIPRTVWAGGCVTWSQGAAGVPVIGPWYEKEQTAMFEDVRLDRLERIPSRLTPEPVAN